MLLCAGAAIPLCWRQARMSCLTFLARRPYKPASLTAHPHFARGSRCGGKVRASDYRSPLRGRLDAPRRLRTTFMYETWLGFRSAILSHVTKNNSKTKLHICTEPQPCFIHFVARRRVLSALDSSKSFIGISFNLISTEV